jgi:glycosyltransferase involved in cell wall biosynthesis
MTKKILIVTDNLPNQINGVVTTFKNIEILAKKEGYNIAFINPSFLPHFSCPGYPEVKISWPFIAKYIKKENPDHIHIATEGPLGLAALLYCGWHNLRYNTSYHTKFPEFLKTMYGIPENFTYRYVRWFHKHSGKVLTTTDTMVKELKEHGFAGEIYSWTRGVDRSVLSPTISHQSDFNKLKPTILYVGRVSKEKNLEALCVLQDKYNIEIVGGGPQLEELKSKYKNINFLGYQSGTELANSYARADVFAFPSKTDTFGIVIIESLSIGTPVAGYPVPGPIDIIEQGINGFISDELDNAILEALKLNRDVVKESSKKWTWEKCWEIFRDNLIPVRNR